MDASYLMGYIRLEMIRKKEKCLSRLQLELYYNESLEEYISEMARKLGEG